MVVLKKGMRPTKKKKLLFSKTKLKPMYQTKKKKKLVLFYKHENSFTKVCTKQALYFKARFAKGTKGTPVEK